MEDKNIGKKFGNLKVHCLYYENKEINYKQYICECNCGEFLVVDELDLLNGNKKSCGCQNHKSFLSLTCKDCNENMHVEFDKRKFKPMEKESFTDYSGLTHYDNIYELDIICPACEFRKSVYKNYNVSIKDKIETLNNFVKEKCTIEEYIEPQNRTTRSLFRKTYINWLSWNKLSNKRLLANEFNLVLKNIYNEKYVKYNGNICLTKIRLKN